MCMIDPMNRLVGTLSRLDVLRPFLRDDVELQTEVEQEIVRRGRAQDTICVEMADEQRRPERSETRCSPAGSA